MLYHFIYVISFYGPNKYHAISKGTLDINEKIEKQNQCGNK